MTTTESERAGRVRQRRRGARFGQKSRLRRWRMLGGDFVRASVFEQSRLS